MTLLLRCPLSFSENKNQGGWYLAGCQQGDNTLTLLWVVGGLYFVKRRGVGRRFWHFDKILRAESSAKSVNCPCGLSKPNQCSDSHNENAASTTLGE